MRPFSRKLFAGIFFCIGLTSAAELSDQSVDVDNEMNRLRRELQQTQTQRQKNQQDMYTDKRDYADYRTRFGTRLESVRSAIDSIQRETNRFQMRRDSLVSLRQSVSLKKREIDLSREALRNRLIASCGKLDSVALHLSPQTQGQIRSSLSLVKNDLELKTIECPETFGRIVQIINLMRDATTSIQTTTENSPIADLRGAAARLRIGCIMDAVIDEKGSVCYVWKGNNADGSPAWELVGDKAAAPEILRAIAVREGKALPALVNLPLTAVGKVGVQ